VRCREEALKQNKNVIIMLRFLFALFVHTELKKKGWRNMEGMVN
jgi:hypothetical protein